MKCKAILILALIGLASGLNAQVTTGTISGYVYEANSKIVLPYAKVWIETESGKRQALSDETGKYKIDALKPGTYNLSAAPSQYDTTVISQIVVNPDGITTVDAYCSQGTILGTVIIRYSEPLITKDVPRILILQEDIKLSLNIRDPKALLAGMSSEVQMPEGTNQVIIRGSRPGDAIFYIDGVKANDMSSIPGVAIQGLEAYTGGIPAKYGDTTGGVVVLETKSYFDLLSAWRARN